MNNESYNMVSAANPYKIGSAKPTKNRLLTYGNLKKYNISEISGDVTNLLKAQAEISFKAGIQEVVEWIKNELPDEYSSISGWSVWQAKLKSWGVQ